MGKFNDITEAVGALFNYLKYQKGLSLNTILAYGYDLKVYGEYLEAKGLSFAKVKTDDIDRFITYCGKELENSIRTINRKIESLKAFYKYLYRIDETDDNLMKKIDSPKMKKPLPKFLKADQQERLLDYFAKRPEKQRITRFIKKRDRAIAMIFIDTGVRVSELCNIRIEDIDFNQGVLRVMGKGNKEAEVVLSPRLMAAMKHYIKQVRPHLLRKGRIVKLKKKGKYSTRRHLPGGGERIIQPVCSKKDAEKALYDNLDPDKGYLFIRNGKKKLDTRHVFRILSLAGHALGFRVHPHLLRHTFASNLRRKGADLLLIKEALRHEDVSTTQIYAHISSARYKKEIGRYLADDHDQDPQDNRLKVIRGGKGGRP